MTNNMNRIIRESLEFWNPWWHGEKRDSGVERPGYLRRLRAMMPMKEAVIIQGIRRSGKSTLMLQLINQLLDKVPAENICYINFDDNALIPFIDDPGFPDVLFETYLEAKGPQGRVYLFFDEVQGLKNWHAYVKKVYDRELQVKFILTGSSAHLLEKEYSSLLTGRTLTLEVFPLSFREFLRFKGMGSEMDEGIDEGMDEGTMIARRPELKRYLNEYFRFGGFPEVVFQGSNDAKITLLKEYFSGIIARDVFMRHSLRNGKRIEETTYYLLSNASNITSMRRLGSMVGSSPHTVQGHLSILEDVYLLFFVPAFSYSYRQQLTSLKKCYAVDTGLVNAASFRFSENAGRAAENVVFLEFRRKGSEVFYWKGEKGKEVDFVVKEGLDVSALVQVCQDITPKVMERETTALEMAMVTFGLKEGTVITESYSGEKQMDAGRISFVPLYIWLLEK